MAKAATCFQAKHDKADPGYRYPSRFGANGEIIYSVPAEINNEDALATFGISIKDCANLAFGSAGRCVYFIETTNKVFAYDQQKWLENQHKRDWRYMQRFISLEMNCSAEGDAEPAGIDSAYLAAPEYRYEELIADDLRKRMVQFVRERYPKNDSYAEALDLHLTYWYNPRQIGEILFISERNARYFLKQALAAAADYYTHYVCPNEHC